MAARGASLAAASHYLDTAAGASIAAALVLAYALAQLAGAVRPRAA